MNECAALSRARSRPLGFALESRLAQANASVWTHIATAMEAQKLATDFPVGGELADEQLRGVVIDMVKLANPEIAISCADGQTMHIEWPPG